MQGDSEDADAPGRVLDHGQDVGLGAVEQVGGEEVARQDRLGLAAQELRPGWSVPPRRGVDSGFPQRLPDCRRRYLYAQAGELTVDPAVPPSGVLAGEPEDECPDVPLGRRPAGLDTPGPGGPAGAHDVT